MGSSDANSAAWLDTLGAPFVVREAPAPPAPASPDVVLRIHAVAINPVDARRQTDSMYTPTYPWIIGSDAAGTVVSCGDEVDNVKPGDKVIALTDEYRTQLSSHGFFQRFTVISSGTLCKVPDGLRFENACVLPLGLCTAAGILFEKETLDLEWPTTNDNERAERDHKDEVVVVWGGSSSVGCSAIQLLRAAGYRAIATASKRNFELVKECGAEAVFDHTDDDCVDQICCWVEGEELRLAGVAAIIIDPEAHKSCAQVARRLPGKKFVSTSLPRHAVPEPDLGEGIQTSNCKSTHVKVTDSANVFSRSGGPTARSRRAYLE